MIFFITILIFLFDTVKKHTKLTLYKTKTADKDSPCRLSYYLLDFYFLPHINEVSVLDTIVLDKLRNSGLVPLSDA